MYLQHFHRLSDTVQSVVYIFVIKLPLCPAYQLDYLFFVTVPVPDAPWTRLCDIYGVLYWLIRTLRIWLRNRLTSCRIIRSRWLIVLYWTLGWLGSWIIQRGGLLLLSSYSRLICRFRLLGRAWSDWVRVVKCRVRLWLLDAPTLLSICSKGKVFLAVTLLKSSHQARHPLLVHWTCTCVALLKWISFWWHHPLGKALDPEPSLMLAEQFLLLPSLWDCFVLCLYLEKIIIW